MKKKRIVCALGRNAFGRTLPEQKVAVRDAANAVADLIEAKYDVILTHSNGFIECVACVHIHSALGLAFEEWLKPSKHNPLDRLPPEADHQPVKTSFTFLWVLLHNNFI